MVDSLTMKSNRITVAIALLLVLSLAPSFLAQNPSPAPSQTDQKAEEVLKRATEVLGGSNYLGVRTTVGRGFFTGFQDGVPTVPTRFLDYIAYPDRERTEFTASGIKVVQTNSGDIGWLYDGATKSLNDMKPSQIEDFKRGMRTTVENLLHGWWRQQGATLKYIGRREAGLAKRNDVVRLTYPDSFWIEYEFGTRDNLPAKIIYRRTRKKPDSEDTEDVTEEDRLAKPITVAGITAPWVIDHFINGVQTSRINYESIEYNQPLSDSLFIKPSSIKAFK